MQRLLNDDRAELLKLYELNGEEVFWETAEELVKASWEAVQARLARHDGAGVRIYYPWGITAYGPFSSLSEAKRKMDGFLGAIGNGVFGQVFTLKAPAELGLKLPAPKTHLCVKCGHQKELHNWPKQTARGCIHGIVTKVTASGRMGKPDYSGVCGCKG